MRNLRSAAVIVAALICAGQVSEAQTVTLFGNAVPSTPVDSDTAAVTLGVKFWSSQPGTIAGIRFYRGYKVSSSGYTVKLFSASGTLLASARTGKDTCAVPCWEEVNFASPISIAANTTYVAAYYTGNGRYADDQYGLANGITSGPLVAPASAQVGGNGVYTYSTGFPTQVWNSSNYYVDISFTSSAPPVAQTPSAVSFSPAGPVNVSDSASAGTTIAAVQVTTSDGKPFAGTVSISAQSASGMVALSAATLPANVQVASVSSTDDGAQTVTVQASENGVTKSATLAINVTSSQLIFYDNFAGNSLSAAWTIIQRHGEYLQNETECNTAGAVTVANNAVTITTTAQTAICGDIYNTPSSWPYTTGDIQWTSFGFLYGTITARMAFPPSNTNTWPAIWMLATNCQASNILTGDTPYGSCPGYLQPGYEEIDWIECYQGGNWCVLNIHSDGQDTVCHWMLSDSNFHDYTMVWTPSGISLSKDGIQVCSTGPPTPSVPMFVILQTQTGGVSGNPNNSNLPTTLTLQNLRVTQP